MQHPPVWQPRVDSRAKGPEAASSPPGEGRARRRRRLGRRDDDDDGDAREAAAIASGDGARARGIKRGMVECGGVGRYGLLRQAVVAFPRRWSRGGREPQLCPAVSSQLCAPRSEGFSSVRVRRGFAREGSSQPARAMSASGDTRVVCRVRPSRDAGAGAGAPSPVDARVDARARSASSPPRPHHPPTPHPPPRSTRRPPPSPLTPSSTRAPATTTSRARASRPRSTTSASAASTPPSWRTGRAARVRRTRWRDPSAAAATTKVSYPGRVNPRASSSLLFPPSPVPCDSPEPG